MEKTLVSPNTAYMSDNPHLITGLVWQIYSHDGAAGVAPHDVVPEGGGGGGAAAAGGGDMRGGGRGRGRVREEVAAAVLRLDDVEVLPVSLRQGVRVREAVRVNLHFCVEDPR